SRTRNCSADRESFSRSFGRTESSLPTLLSQTTGRSEQRNRSRTVAGKSRVITIPFLPARWAIKNKRYASSGVDSFTRYDDESFRRGSVSSSSDRARSMGRTCGAPHDGQSTEPAGISSPHAMHATRDGARRGTEAPPEYAHPGHSGAPGGLEPGPRGPV